MRVLRYSPTRIEQNLKAVEAVAGWLRKFVEHMDPQAQRITIQDPLIASAKPAGNENVLPGHYPRTASSNLLLDQSTLAH